jgi:hypothetical protein
MVRKALGESLRRFFLIVIHYIANDFESNTVLNDNGMVADTHL